jgi:hypothetical protein
MAATPRDNTTPGVQDATQRDAVPLATDKGTTADLTGIMQVKTTGWFAGSERTREPFLRRLARQ